MIGSGRDLRVLREIGFLSMLTTSQVKRLAFPSRRRAQRRLRAYLDQGLVRAHLQGDALHRDNVWTLTRAGWVFLESGGVDMEGVKTCRLNARSQKLRHSLLVRDPAVSLLVAENSGLLTVLDIRLDAELAKDNLFISAGLVPDGYGVVEIHGIERVVLWEVATGSQSLCQLRDKLLAYERAAAGNLAFFRNQQLRLLFLVESEKRLVHLGDYAGTLRLRPRLRLLRLDDGRDDRAFLRAIGGDEGGFRPA